jgi:hypothetical protein
MFSGQTYNCDDGKDLDMLGCYLLKDCSIVIFETQMSMELFKTSGDSMFERDRNMTYTLRVPITKLFFKAL